MKKTNMLVFLLAFALGAIAQESQPQKTSFSLFEALEYAKIHNRNIQNASASIQAAEQQKWEATAIGLPQISGKVEYQAYLKPPISGDPNNPEDPINFFFPKNSLSPSLTVSQLIFDGSYIVALQASKVFLDISKNLKEKTDNEIEETVVNAYMTALLTDESILILNRNIKNIKENLAEADAFVRNGLAEEETAEQLELTLNNLENSLKNYRVLAEVSNGYVKLLLGIDSETQITLSDDLDGLINQYVTLDENYQKTSVFNNIDYKIALNETKTKKLEYKLEKTQYMPSLSAFLSTNAQALNDEFGGMFKSEQPWLTTNLAGVSMQIPIFTSFKTRSKVKRAKINWEISQNTLKDVEQQLLLDIKKARSEYNLATETYYNRKKNLALAEKIERKNTVKFRQGMASSIDLRTVQSQLYESQQQYIESIIDVINTKVALKNLLNIK